MKLREYICDKRYFILFYVLLMTFVTLVVSLDSKKSITFDNILYINIVALSLVLIYIISGYIYYKRYFNTLQNIVSHVEDDIIHHLPESLTYQGELYNKLIKKAYNEQSIIIEKQNLEKRENKDFVTSWFHQIKTPIAVSRLIIEDNAEHNKSDIIKSLSEEIDKIESQVDQALYYSKIDVFEKDYFIQEFNLNGVVGSVIRKHAREFIAKKIELNKKDVNIRVSSDKKWLIFIIDQILSNSLKYTGNRGKISIWAEEHNGNKILVIKDTGIGIKEEDLTRVFNKGFTGCIGRREEKSTGIGLYLAKKLAKRLGHNITIKSQYGKYTEVKLIFPRLSSFYDLSE